MKNTIKFSEGVKIAKIFAESMVEPLYEQTSLGYFMTDGHYTINCEVFGRNYLKEITLLGEVVAELDDDYTSDELSELLGIPEEFNVISYEKDLTEI